MMISISRFVRRLASLRKNEDGTQLVETAIWLGVITAAAIGAIVAMRDPISSTLQGVAEAVNSNMGTTTTTTGG